MARGDLLYAVGFIIGEAQARLAFDRRALTATHLHALAALARHFELPHEAVYFDAIVDERAKELRERWKKPVDA